MPDFYNPTQHLGSALSHQKMYDFEHDMLRVKNPLNADFTYMYDSENFTVPANGTVEMERYRFRRYLQQIMGHIFDQVQTARFEKAQESFTRTHPDVINDPYMMNEQVWLKLPRADDLEFQKKVHDDCFVGVVSKAGANRIITQRPNNAQLDPNTPLYQQLINDDNRMIDDTIVESAPVATQPLSQADISDVTI